MFLSSDSSLRLKKYTLFFLSMPPLFFEKDYFMGQFPYFWLLLNFCLGLSVLPSALAIKAFLFKASFHFCLLPPSPFSFTFFFYQTSLCFLAMAIPRTPDLTTWDLPSPAIHTARSLGLQLGAEIPLFADTRTHLCGLATGVVSA